MCALSGERDYSYFGNLRNISMIGTLTLVTSADSDCLAASLLSKRCGPGQSRTAGCSYLKHVIREVVFLEEVVNDYINCAYLRSREGAGQAGNRG